MAYQQPTVFFGKPTELTSEDFLNGVKTQDAAETFRRKRALADAFSASITTKPVIADSDIYDAQGNRTQTKGDILARPGDVDQQKFFQHAANAGLGFDEAAAVYSHYDMQKKAALSALKTGNEINALGGGTGVEGRAGAPVMRDQPAPQAQAAPTGLGTQDQAAQAAPESSIVESKAKADMIARMLASKNKSDIKKAQTALGVKVDGRVGNESKGALAQLQAKLSEGDWKPGEADVFDATPEHTNTSNIGGRIVTTPEGRLSIDSAFEPQPSKFINAETMQAGRPDTRTSLQVIEDRGAANNFGNNESDVAYKAGDVKVRDVSKFPKELVDNLKQQGLGTSDLQEALDLKLRSITPPSLIDKDGKIDALGFTQRKKEYKAKLAEAEGEFYKDIASGNTATVSRNISKDTNKRAETEFMQQQMSVSEFNKKYNASVSSSTLPKALETAAKVEKVKSMGKDLDEVIKWESTHPNATPEEFGAKLKNIDNIVANAETINTDSGRDSYFSDVRRIAPSLGQAISRMKKPSDLAYFIRDNGGALSRKQILNLYKATQEAVEKNGQAAAEMRTFQSGAQRAMSDKVKGNSKSESRAERMKRLGL